MKRFFILILLGIIPLLGEWFSTTKVASCLAQPIAHWNRNLTTIPEPIKETLAVAFPTYIIIEFKTDQSKYTILLKSAEESIYVSINSRGEILNEAGAYTLRT